MLAKYAHKVIRYDLFSEPELMKVRTAGLMLRST